MAATITTELKDNSKDWVEKLKARFIEGGGAAKDFEAHAKALSDELNSRKARQAAADIKAFADEMEAADAATEAAAAAAQRLADQEAELIAEFTGAAVKTRVLTGETYQLAAAEDKLADEFQQCANEAAQNGRALQRYVNSIKDVDRAAQSAGKSVATIPGGGMASKLTAAFTGVLALKEVFAALAGAARTAYAALARFAEVNPKFAELKTTIDGLGASINRAANEFAASDFGSRALQKSAGTVKFYGEAIEALPSFWRNVGVVFNSYQADVLEGMGLQAGRQRQLISLANEEEFAIRARVELARQEAEIKASNLRTEQVRAAVTKSNLDAVDARNIAALENEAQVIAAIKEEEARLKEKDKLGKVSEEAAAAAIARLAALNARQRQLQDDHRAKEKQARADAVAKEKKDLEDKIAREKKAEDEITAAKKRAEEDRLAAWREMNDKRREAEQQAAQERIQMAEAEAQQKKAAFEKSAENQKGNAGSVLGMIRPQDLARQIANQKGMDATNAYVKKNVGKYAKATVAKKDIDKKIRSMRNLGLDAPRDLVDKSKAYGKVITDYRKGKVQAGSKARQMGYRDTMAGRSDSKDIAEAQQQLTDNIIKSGVNSGKLSMNQAAALREAARVLINQQQEINSAMDEINAVKRALAAMGKGGKPPGKPGESF